MHDLRTELQISLQTGLDLGIRNSPTVSDCQSLRRYQNGSEETKHALRTELQNILQTGLDLWKCNGLTVSNCQSLLRYQMVLRRLNMTSELSYKTVCKLDWI